MVQKSREDFKLIPKTKVPNSMSEPIRGEFINPCILAYKQGTNFFFQNFFCFICPRLLITVKLNFPLPRGPSLRVMDVAHTGFPMLVLYLLSLAHRSVTSLRGTGGGCRWQTPDHLNMAEPKAEEERQGGAPWYKTRQWSYLGSGWKL